MTSTTYDYYAIIVAGGSGSRMKSDVPKQFLLLNGKPILQHTIERFMSVSLVASEEAATTPPEFLPIQIILVLPARELPIWERLCDQHEFYPVGIQTVIGGETRFQSVRNGLKAIPPSAGELALVAVHDGVRPFVSPEIIRNSYATAARTGSAVACVSAKDSVRKIAADGSSVAIDRSTLRLIQTPQTFELGMFRRAFAVAEQSFFTDCASVVEFAGYPITLIDGAYENIKITTPDDLVWGETVYGR